MIPDGVPYGGSYLHCQAIDRKAMHLAHSGLLNESKYAVAAAVVGFLFALVLSHGSPIAGLGVLARIAGIGWAGRPILERRGSDSHED